MVKPPRFRVLGPIEVLEDDVPLALGGPRQRLILAVLLAFPNQVVSASRLIDEVWGEAPPNRPTHSLQTYISNLRRLFRDHGLGNEQIVTRAHGYMLRVDPDDIDALRFERLFKEARSAGDEEALELLTSALGMWNGPAYEEFLDGDVVQVEAIRLGELHLLAKEYWFECLLRQGRLDGELAELEGFVAGEPFRERPRAMLMQTLHRAGRQPEALRVYAEYRDLLGEQLGLAPSRQLQELEIAILQDDVGGPQPTSPPATVLNMAEVLLDSFERAKGEHVAYGSIGHGSVVVKPPGWMSNLDLLAAGLDYAQSGLVSRLAENFRVVTYDRYGIGLSTGSVTDFSLKASVAELLSLLEVLDLHDITLFGESAAGPIVIAAAAAAPERVSRLIFLGSCASARELYDSRTRESFLTLVRGSWGLGSDMLSSALFPGSSVEVHDAFVRLQRKSSNGETATGYLEQLYDADVSDLLPAITQPALIMHYRGDRAVPYEGANQLAFGLPNARLIPLDGASHFPLPEDVERIATTIEEFLN